MLCLAYELMKKWYDNQYLAIKYHSREVGQELPNKITVQALLWAAVYSTDSCFQYLCTSGIKFECSILINWAGLQ